MRLQFITHQTAKHTYYESALMALRGGCRWIQLRMKGAPLDEVEQEALRVQCLCRSYGALFIINDYVDLAARLGADGVHVGLEDMPVAEARRRLGHDRLVGGTANTFADVLRHASEGADYVGCGPFRFTTTKKRLAPVLGAEGYRTLSRQMREAGLHLPLIAVGGITADDIPSLLEAGADGVALSGAILRAPDPVAETRRIHSLIENHKP